MIKEKTTRWNVLDGLRNEKEISAYLKEALAEGDYNFFISAVGDAVRAYGVNNMAKKIGVNRESLYRSFSGKRRPNFETVLKAIDELGLKIDIAPKSAK
ncbi:MAG: putative addiction module antidote protein [Leptospirales bacterium]|nr:putative addiction module antidote protein [Leptospirales bacterium]